MKKWICPRGRAWKFSGRDCGHICFTHEGEEAPTDDCPLCGTPAEDYELEN